MFRPPTHKAGALPIQPPHPVDVCVIVCGAHVYMWVSVCGCVRGDGGCVGGGGGVMMMGSSCIQQYFSFMHR